jgi:hypothetical protein
MTHWMCVNCGYYLQTDLPPNRCPSCNEACVFNNVTCYRPDCGGERNIDPLLVGATLGSLTRSGMPPTAPPVTAPKESAFPMIKVLQGLNEKQKAEIRAIGHIVTYEQGTIICREGDESPALYIVEEGQATVQSAIGPGVSMPLTMVSEGQAFGWSVLVPPYILTASVVASSRVKVLVIDKDRLMSLIKNDPELGLIIMENVAAIVALRLRNVELEMTGLIKNKS